jgi:hypothetical protein
MGFEVRKASCHRTNLSLVVRLPEVCSFRSMRKGTAMYQDYKKKEKESEASQSAEEKSSIQTAGGTESEAPTASSAVDSEVET